MMIGRVYPAVMALGKSACMHRIKDARNSAIQSGYVCVDCGAIFSAADHGKLAQPAVPEGFVLVPIEPTQAMLDAVVSTLDDFLIGACAEDQYRMDWAAMIAAHKATTEKTK